MIVLGERKAIIWPATTDKSETLDCQNRYGGTVVYLDDSEIERETFALWERQIREHGGKTIAMIGGGLGLLPSRLLDYPATWDIYELHSEIKNEVRRRYPESVWRWIIGDYLLTFPEAGKTYDIIVLDADEEYPAWDSLPLNKGGLVLVSNYGSHGGVILPKETP